MTRALYLSLLWLHPPGFRRQFAPEILLIFQQAAPREGSVALLFDAVVSLVRQWILRSGLWKAAAAALCSVSQLGPSLFMGWRPRNRVIPAIGVPIQPDGFVAIAGFLIAFIIMMVAASVFWATTVSRLRRPPARRRAIS